MSRLTRSRNSKLATLRRFLAAVLAAAVVFAIIVAVIYRQDLRQQENTLEQQSQHVLMLQYELVQFELAAVKSDLLYLATQHQLHRFLQGDPNDRPALADEYASFAEQKRVYDQIRFLDDRGHEIIRVNYRDGRADRVADDRLQSKASRYYFQQGWTLSRGEVFVSQLDLNVEHGKIERPPRPVIRFATPVFDQAGEKRGLLVLNYLGDYLLAKLKEAPIGFPGDVLLANSEGEYLLARDPSREWGWLLGHGHSFRDDFPQAWREVRNAELGKLRVDGNLLAFQRVVREMGGQSDSNSLILIAHVEAAVAESHSRVLLAQLLPMYLGALAVVAFISLYWARSSVLRNYHEQQIADSEARLRQLSRQLLSAQELERRGFSRDLHDDLGQLVTAISLDLRSLRNELGAEANPLLEQAIAETDQLLKSLHTLATKVRPSVLDDLGLRDAVESYLSEYQTRTGVAVDARLNFSERQIDPTIGENVYRIFQEALSNVASHAQVKEAEVTMETTGNHFRMTIADAGVGVEMTQLEQSSRLGVLGMRERAELLNGRFELRSAKGEGTSILVEIPLGLSSGSDGSDSQDD